MGWSFKLTIQRNINGTWPRIRRETMQRSHSYLQQNVGIIKVHFQCPFFHMWFILYPRYIFFVRITSFNFLFFSSYLIFLLLVSLPALKLFFVEAFNDFLLLWCCCMIILFYIIGLWCWFFLSFAGKNGLLSEKMTCCWQKPIRIDDPYESYELLIRKNHTDQKLYGSYGLPTRMTHTDY